ncbi:hypothetical protein FQR65_LT07637 [Abscondita terminalis]|nr:hypothetical protein FQR65_LT07637 [Abscondita terminalis]
MWSSAEFLVKTKRSSSFDIRRDLVSRDYSGPIALEINLRPRRDRPQISSRLVSRHQDRIFRLPLLNINQTRCEEDVLILDPSHVENCVSKGKSEHFDCRNHIRVIQPIGDGTQLYVCGTNAHNPKDWIIYANLSRLNLNSNFRGIGSGIAKCPYDPLDNSTAIWVENGNPGKLAGLYSGTNAEFTKADTVIFRTDLYNFTTGHKHYNFKRTLKYDSKWLDKANFVGSYDIGQYVLFFFSETAVEYINCGKTVYSRVARVCKNDTGGKNILSQNWATYTKSRLNCSIPGEFPFYFDEIQSIYKIPGDDSRFFGTFTTSSNSLMGSAICVFRLLDIDKTFAGRFKEQASSLSAWLPVLSSRVPEPRPGECVQNTESLPDNVLNFIRTHPLMDMAVNHENNKPVFFRRDLVFTKLVVDKIKVDNGIYASEYIIYYVGTSDGQIYKILQWHNYKNESFSSLLDIFDVTPGESIQSIELFYKTKTLYVASDSQIKQIHLVMCGHRYDSCFRCVRDPYCGWDRDNRVCKYYYLGLLQDATNSDSNICNYNTPRRKVTATWGQTIHLTCFFELPLVFKSKIITWYHNYQNNWKSQIVFSSEKFIETSQKGIIILSVTEEDAGLYECFIESKILCSFNLTVDSYRCGIPDRARNYEQVYSEWCHEFERYKFAMKLWEKKHFKCPDNDNATSYLNTIPE